MPPTVGRTPTYYLPPVKNPQLFHNIVPVSNTKFPDTKILVDNVVLETVLYILLHNVETIAIDHTVNKRTEEIKLSLTL
jgi:hypothetical protein